MPTCTELRIRLAATRREWQFAASAVRGYQGDVAELEKDHTTDPQMLAAAQRRLADAKVRLQQIEAQYAALESTFEEQGCFAIQPQRILDIAFDNPQDVRDIDALYAQTVAFGGPTKSIVLGGPWPSRDAQQAWKQVLPADLISTAAHEADYEGRNLVGAVGWMLNPGFSSSDDPFGHPFGFDWEFMMALDQPVQEPRRFTFLLTPADQSCDEGGFAEAVKQAGEAKDANGLPIIPLGPDGLPDLLGVEIDGGLVPRQFTDFVGGGAERGDRVAVFGRWIVDCGHQIPITRCGGQTTGPTNVHPGVTAFRTEIHPPLLMAAARVMPREVSAPGVLQASPCTRLLVTSRPFLVGQRYSTDTGDALYDDHHPDDGPFFSHMLNEVKKVNETIVGIPTQSVQVEAHPKIKSYPFLGSYEMHLIVRPPAPPGPLVPGPLAVAFQFTVRQGCTVQVRPGADASIVVVIKFDQGAYRRSNLPPRHERTWTREDLGHLDKDAESSYFEAEAVSGAIHVVLGDEIGAAVVEAILERGILTDEYDTSAMTGTNILDASKAFTALASDIPDFTQLDTLQREQAAAIGEVRSDEADLAELQTEGGRVNPQALAAVQKRLADAKARLQKIDQEIAALPPPTRGVVQDNGQPFPVFGWLEVGYLAPLVVA
jgi:hypothetical protein